MVGGEKKSTCHAFRITVRLNDMKTINSIKPERFKEMLFPDNQPHIVIHDVFPGEEVRVVHPIRSSLELVQLMLIGNAIKHAGATPVELVIPYLMAARYDRVINPGDSFDLEVVADCINSIGFKNVHIFDAHSPVATKLIKNSKSHNNSKLVKAYSRPNSVLIVPDKGASLKAGEYQSWNTNIADVVECDKSRDLQTGKVSLIVHNPELCLNRNCVIIDDICDGGATFLTIAQQIKPAHLTLIVSHGIFSKGFSALKEHFHDIITTDSFWHHAGNKVTTIPLNL